VTLLEFGVDGDVGVFSPEVPSKRQLKLGCHSSGAQPMKNFSPLQQISIACAILAILFYFALQIPWVAALFG